MEKKAAQQEISKAIYFGVRGRVLGLKINQESQTKVNEKYSQRLDDRSHYESSRTNEWEKIDINFGKSSGSKKIYSRNLET